MITVLGMKLKVLPVIVFIHVHNNPMKNAHY